MTPESTRIRSSDPSLLAPDYVRGIARYVAGKPIDELAREFGLDPSTIVKLASNENPRGAGPAVRKAIAAAVEDLSRYPDGNGFALKSALAARFGVGADD
ncbi:MAG: histidinol-phosphate transaminase, partial [Casimicrobiaceae bacterium]